MVKDILRTFIGLVLKPRSKTTTSYLSDVRILDTSESPAPAARKSRPSAAVVLPSPFRFKREYNLWIPWFYDLQVLQALEILRVNIDG